MTTTLSHDHARFAPFVVAGFSRRWEAQGGLEGTESNRLRLEEAGIPCHLIEPLTREVNPIKDLLALHQLIRLFRQEQPALVHTHTSKAGVLGRLAAWVTGVQNVVHTPHGHVFYGHFGGLTSWVFLQIERVLAKRTSKLIALTEAERDEHLARGVGRADNFAVIPSGIDLDRYRSLVGVRGQRPACFACPPDAIVVGSVGWLTQIKGHQYLIEAIARLKPTFPRLHLVLIGSGGLRDDLKALAARLGIRESVTFTGEQSDVPECLASMDVFVLPSLNEGMGRALVEAMAAGRPVIASRVGGVPALIQDRRNGLLVPAGDAHALSEALSEFLRRPHWAKELGTAASESVGKRFQAAEMVHAIEAVYEEVLCQGDR